MFYANLSLVIFSDINDYEITALLRATEILAKCSGDYVVQYFDHWIENNDCLYIQMELCSDNLKNIIQQKQQFFREDNFEPMKPIEYFISCQLFVDVLQCVRYLHYSNIMHRNLKKENILIVQNANKQILLKLGGFFQVKFEGTNKDSHTTGAEPWSNSKGIIPVQCFSVSSCIIFLTQSII